MNNKHKVWLIIAIIGLSIFACDDGSGNTTEKPTLTGTVIIDNMVPKVGDTLIADYIGNGTGSAAWQWLRDDDVISGANSNKYTVTDADVGKTLKARVSCTDQSGSVTSNATAAVTSATLLALSGTVTINNTAPKVGDTLTANYSGNGTGSAAWHWLRDDDVISGANSNNYTVTDADVGKTLKASVSFANQSGTRTSSATLAVIQTGASLIYYWVNEQNELVFTNGSSLTVAPGVPVNITAQDTGYTVIRWNLNGINTGHTGMSYPFSSWVTAKHTIDLLVEKGGEYYSASITITVE